MRKSEGAWGHTPSLYTSARLEAALVKLKHAKESSGLCGYTAAHAMPI